MFVGHALLAFALVAAVAHRLGSERALTLGVVAAAFAAVPDVDIGYALVGVASHLGGVGVAGATGAGGTAAGDAVSLAATFWSTGNVVHRAVTHSLVVAPVVAAAAALWVTDRTDARLVGAALLGGLVAVAAAVSGALGAAVMLAFAVAALLLAAAVAGRTDLTPAATFAVAAFGLLSHPFGDLFTGEPPRLLYPLGVELVPHRVALSPDPTLHLLAAFGVELATVWAAALVWARIRATDAGGPARLLPRVDARAVAGAGYAASALVIPAPTLDLSYPFVFSVLAVGLVGVAPRVRLRPRTWRIGVARPGPERTVFTALAAVTVAAAAYLLAYLGGVA
ncbi:metal-dependent hydrolase [Halobaculum sp. D14]|uniref:metal-dependent hydrolase n=1 Tax=Halobaculum sp. D14 TaxID=3421642 RepID=UPI003EC0700A